MNEMIQVNNLSKKFHTTAVVDSISFSVKKGELFGFLGVNGAGKSTTINMLCTLYEKTSGNVLINGLELGKDNAKIRRHIGVIFQENTLDDMLTVKENLFTRASLYESDSSKIRTQVADICKMLEISDLLSKKYHSLSGGQKRRVEIARALLHKPDILFLDEPTTGLDPKTRKLIWEQILYLKQHLGMTIFLTTHSMEEASMAEHIVIINKGKIIADATPFELKENYTSDVLRLDVTDKDEVSDILRSFGYPFTEDSNCYHVSIPDTISSLPLLSKLSPYLKAFEVLQGTMEDAFLTITKQIKMEG
ncbi:MAG: ABC transporter ATP-binding protein [Lachnospiraceae bacterium]|nr:ABC transporter ATP-binding protein [Lachnospiraceae bacterium]